MSDTALYFTHSASWWERRRRQNAAVSLARAIWFIGLPDIPMQKVRKHMRDVDQKRCPTWGLWFCHLLSRVIWVLMLHPVFRWLMPNASQDRRMNVNLVFIFGLFLFGAIIDLVRLKWGLSFATVPPLSLIILLAQIVPIAAGVYYLYALGIPEHTIAFWTTHRYVSFKASGEKIPQRIAERVALVEAELPGATIKVISDSIDPFLMVERGCWPFRERVVIGAWNTGTDMDEK